MHCSFSCKDSGVFTHMRVKIHANSDTVYNKIKGNTQPSGKSSQCTEYNV